MRKGNLLALGALLGAISLVYGAAGPPAPKPLGAETFVQRVARTSKVSEDDVAKVWAQLGAAIKEDLVHGQQVSIPGLGTMRVVRVPDHKDLKDGRPVTIAGTNTVEFLAGPELTTSVNAKNVEPAETVPEYRFTVFPNQTPGQKVPSTRTPGQRVPPQ